MPISMKLCINHPWVMGVLNCSNKGPGPFQRGDNYKIAKMGWRNLKGLSHRFSRIFLFFTMHNYCISDHKTKMPVSYDKLKERYKPQMLCYVNFGRLTYIARCI
jgi:hypothetical protein